MELLSFPFLVQQSPLVEVGSSLPGKIWLLQCAASSRETQSAPWASVPWGPLAPASEEVGQTQTYHHSPEVPIGTSALWDCFSSRGDSQVFPGCC